MTEPGSTTPSTSSSGGVHPTLARQLRRLDLTPTTPPNLGLWAELLERVNSTYNDTDNNRCLLERSLAISSSEMRGLYEHLRTTSDRELRAERDRLQVVFNSVPDALVVVDPYGVVTDVNQHSRHLLGAPVELVGRLLSDVVSCSMKGDPMRTPMLSPATLDGAIKANGWKASDLVVSGPLGRSFPADCTIVPFRNDDGVTGAVIVFADASEREAARARLHWHSTHDSLTQLPNRVLLIDRLEESLVAARSTGEWPGVLCIDIDHFKRINETLGHETGDAVLVMAADRIASTLRAGDTVARMGGDEFLVLCEGVDTPSHLRRAADRLSAALAQPFTIGDDEVVLSVSMGIATADVSTPSADALLRHADMAAGQAKEQGRNRIVDLAESDAGNEHTAIIEALRDALANDEFSVVYQPIAQVADGRLVGFEALLRWHSGRLGPVPPGLFIPIAERIGLMSAIGSWVLDVAARDAASWQAARGTDLAVHVNISECQLLDPALARQVADLHHRHGLAAGTLTLEITEEMLVADPVGSTARMKALRGAGAGLAIDDFGTGHVSLADLRHFPLRTLKVDREFVSGMPTSAQDRRIVQAIIDLAHGLDHVVIAEGVENDAELALLQELGCDMAQGWLFGHPLSPQEALLVAASATSRSL